LVSKLHTVCEEYGFDKLAFEMYWMRLALISKLLINLWEL